MIQTLEAIAPDTEEALRVGVVDEVLIDRSNDITLPLAERAAYLGALCIMEETSRANEHYSQARAKADWREGMIALDMQERAASRLGQVVCIPTLRGPEFRPGLERLTIEVERELVEISPHKVMGVLHEHAMFLNGTPVERADAGMGARPSQVPDLPGHAISHSVQLESERSPARNRLGLFGRVAAWFRSGRRHLSQA